MKTLNVAVKGALLAVALLLCACATTTAPNARLQADHRDGPAVVDAHKMAVIDHIARRKGVDVVWINPPHLPRTD